MFSHLTRHSPWLHLLHRFYSVVLGDSLKAPRPGGTVSRQCGQLRSEPPDAWSDFTAGCGRREAGRLALNRFAEKLVQLQVSEK